LSQAAVPSYFSKSPNLSVTACGCRLENRMHALRVRVNLMASLFERMIQNTSR
jgi:hypothetical protein